VCCPQLDLTSLYDQLPPSAPVFDRVEVGSGRDTIGGIFWCMVSKAVGERLDEVAEILALGLRRLKARQSSTLAADFGESSLDSAGEQSGPANVLTDGGRS
jgi:hypothetical protein